MLQQEHVDVPSMEHSVAGSCCIRPESPSHYPVNKPTPATSLYTCDRLGSAVLRPTYLPYHRVLKWTPRCSSWWPCSSPRLLSVTKEAIKSTACSHRMSRTMTALLQVGIQGSQWRVLPAHNRPAHEHPNSLQTHTNMSTEFVWWMWYCMVPCSTDAVHRSTAGQQNTDSSI